jgi:hypothetical protein
MGQKSRRSQEATRSMRQYGFSHAVFTSLCLLGLTSTIQAHCSNETLRGMYAFRSEATPVSGGKRLNLALLEFHGDGTYSNLGYTVNSNGVITTGTLTANYQINANCSGQLLNPDGSVQGPIITKTEGSEFYFLRTNPPDLLLVGTATKIDRSRLDEQH